MIIDEIHALVPTKRGAHLALSVERLAAWCGRPLQRIGLSATQRPLDEVARFLGGVAQSSVNRRPAPVKGRKVAGAGRHSSVVRREAAETEVADEFAVHRGEVRYREVTVIDAGSNKALALTIEVPVEDMARITTADEIPSGPASVGDARPSIWAAIHPRLLELIRAHRSTLIFVNSRRLAERLAGALNELAGETLVRSHHGSIARPQRIEVEDLLKSGSLRALVATSSLELGIDMGAIDLVVQIEAPPSVASGLQRIGRAAIKPPPTEDRARDLPEIRDLVACAAVTRPDDGRVETPIPQPADIVAQQVVAMTSMDEWSRGPVRHDSQGGAVCRVYVVFICADMLSGRYPSDEFAS